MAGNLQERARREGQAPSSMLRNSQLGTYIYPVVPAEFTNWRREQKAWRETAVLFDQSHHMVNFFVSGPDALRAALATPASTASRTSRVNTAKQFVPTASNGGVIGDGILFHEAEDEFVYVGRAPARTGCSSTPRPAATTSRSATTTARPRAPTAQAVNREYYRFQIQGPNAWQIIEKLNGGALEQVKFFHMGELTIAGEHVRTLRHGMAGAPGLELWGPYEQHGKIRDAILEAGARVRHRAVRLARVLVEHARVGLDPLAAAGDLLERGRARLPRVAARRTATRRSTRSPARSSRTTSRTTTSTRGSSATARS